MRQQLHGCFHFVRPSSRLHMPKCSLLFCPLTTTTSNHLLHHQLPPATAACYQSPAFPLQAALFGLDFMSEQRWEEPAEIKHDGSVWSLALCLSLFFLCEVALESVSLPQFFWFGHFFGYRFNCQCCCPFPNNVVQDWKSVNCSIMGC